MRRLPGWPNEDLHVLLTKYKTPYFHPECKGQTQHGRSLSDSKLAKIFDGAICGKCHVRISEPWFSKMKSNIHQIEKDTLFDTQFNLFPNSRLACGIKLQPWMNEMIITQPRHNDPYGIVDEDYYEFKISKTKINEEMDLWEE